MRRGISPPLPLNAWLRYDLIRRSLLEHARDAHTMLEIGAGNGAIGARLARTYDYTGLEPDPAAFVKAEVRIRPNSSAQIMCADSFALDPSKSFDVVCSFEVLEHLEDDRSALDHWRTKVRPGGWLVLSVPARPTRFGRHDCVVGHYRRYDAGGLERLLRDCGFDDVRVRTCGFPLGYALEAARNVVARAARGRGGRSMQEQTAASGRWLQPPEAIGWLTAAVAAPFRLVQRPFAGTRFGTGLVAVARRPG
jgi:SAM-dependent methyltransferase